MIGQGCADDPGATDDDVAGVEAYQLRSVYY
jgi:hypothetical protein